MMRDHTRPGLRAATAALALLLALGAGPAAAQTVLPPAQERIAVEAMSRLKSPYTAFHTVDMCPSAPALRDSIRVAAAGGMTTEEIVEEVIARHGEHLRILPKRTGPGLWAWLAPPLLLIGGALLIARRFRGGGDEVAPSAAGGTLSESDRSEVAAALREWERGGGGADE